MNDEEIPTLYVNNLILGFETSDSIGLFVDIGTLDFFKYLSLNHMTKTTKLNFFKLINSSIKMGGRVFYSLFL